VLVVLVVLVVLLLILPYRITLSALETFPFGVRFWMVFTA
jgi:hypothetical protein